ncbi:hypothetical protein CKY39_20610 [Variovorax boronicumulans]|uniref:DUF4238 domain-containing protein n=1 Tax=Variovorax boronicumulans TaxID=436515 RepID=A0A250DMK2_9BURK|nr:hypothetical protein CKY39_20610 [Variovorax boronicumulans]
MNETRNQHYLSQGEQRLNTSTPNAKKKRNQRIYEFEVLGRFEQVALGEPKNRRIEANLALDDIFSFEVDPEIRLRQNFEVLFQRYEDSLITRTEAFLKKAEAKARPPQVKDDLVGLFAAKLLNFARNPYCVPKVLDTFKSFLTVRPTDPATDDQLNLVLNGNRPHQTEICKRFDLSVLQYQQWLQVLFMLLTEMNSPNGQESLFDGMVRSLFNKRTTAVMVTVIRHTTDKCLLSDRSFNSPINANGMLCFEFNLRHDTFIRYVFADRAAWLPTEIPPHLLTALDLMEPIFSIDYRVDDRAELSRYNLNAVNQCHSRVFCSVDSGILIAR